MNDELKGQTKMNDIESINPKNGRKYSQNLYRFAKKFPCASPLPDVCRRDGELWIGILEADWFTGCRLMEILSSGRKVHIGCYPFSESNSLCEVVENFWEDYIRIGRCAIDTSHSMFFVGVDDRWQQIDGNHRQCTWCGRIQKQQRKVVRQTIKTWVDA